MFKEVRSDSFILLFSPQTSIGQEVVLQPQLSPLVTIKKNAGLRHFREGFTF